MKNTQAEIVSRTEAERIRPDRTNLNSARSRNNGITLIEIMVSVLILSIGLLGVIAAIPYGGFQMEKMRDSDFTAMVGRNAIAMIEANQWYLPENWLYPSEFRDVNITNINNGFCKVPAGMPGSYTLQVPNASTTYGQYFIKANQTITNPFNSNLNLFYPIMLDGIGASIEGNRLSARPVGVFNIHKQNIAGNLYNYPAATGYIRVCPKRARSRWVGQPLTGVINNTQNDLDDLTDTFQARMDYIFRTHDDLNYGIPGKTDETTQEAYEGAMRPVIASSALEYPDETNYNGFFKNGNTSVANRLDAKLYDSVSDFTGAYSWMAMLQPHAMESDNMQPISNVSAENINSVDVDVIVFKRRLDSVPAFLGVQKLGYGLNGGTFRLYVNTNDNINHQPKGQISVNSLASNANIATSSSLASMTDLAEALKTTSYLMLMGDDWNNSEIAPLPSNNAGIAYRKFAKWYKIANFSEPYSENSVTYIDVTLIGPDCLTENTNWIPSVRAVVFPNVIGVYQKTITVKQ